MDAVSFNFKNVIVLQSCKQKLKSNERISKMWQSAVTLRKRQTEDEALQ